MVELGDRSNDELELGVLYDTWERKRQTLLDPVRYEILRDVPMAKVRRITEIPIKNLEENGIDWWIRGDGEVIAQTWIMV